MVRTLNKSVPTEKAFPNPKLLPIAYPPTPTISVADTIVQMLENMGVRFAFGVSGGAISPVWAALESSQINVLHFRHEAGAVFAAIEASLISGDPVAIFTTAGPGITNALTGLLAARWEEAKVIFLSPATSAPQRGKWAFQETSNYTMPLLGLYSSGALFHYATTLESADELPEVSRRLAQGIARPNGFIAHISIPTDLQSRNSTLPLPTVKFAQTLATASEKAIAHCANLLATGSFAIWIGFGARHSSRAIRQLAERTGAAVICSPRGKGIFPEDHPQFVGVTGFGGHTSVLAYMQVQQPERILVLGTRLGEFTSFWNPAMIPKRGFIHVDIDPEVPGAAYPDAETFGIQSDVGIFLKTLLKHFPKTVKRSPSVKLSPHEGIDLSPQPGLVRPEFLMAAIQQAIVENSDAPIITEAGNSFAWGNHHLRFSQPHRYRVSTGFGSMGHAATGVLGTALAKNGKAVAILGDGAMLMNNEVSTAVKYKIPAVWIVLNDAHYNMCAQGMSALGFKEVDTTIPPADFVLIARGMGADGICVEKESDLQMALEKALSSTVPFVVDVAIDPSQPAPCGSRIQSLIAQGATELKGV